MLIAPGNVVYEKDLGEGSLGAFEKIERFNPDRSWTPVMQPE